MQKHIFLILILFFLFLACVNQRNKTSHYTEDQIASLSLDSTTLLKVETKSLLTVDLNPFLKKQEYDLGSLIDEVKLIPLETTDESLVSSIYKIIVTGSNIYIYDKFKGGGIIIFDKGGKFVKRIPYGQGPGEIMN